MIPVALLSALIAVQVFTSGSELTLDARAVGLGVAVVLLVMRAPFLVVVFGAAGVAALLRLVAWRGPEPRISPWQGLNEPGRRRHPPGLCTARTCRSRSRQVE